MRGAAVVTQADVTLRSDSLRVVLNREGPQRPSEVIAEGNVRIDALYEHLPRRAAAACDLLAVLALLAFATLVAWHGFAVMSHAWAIGSRSNTSLAVPLAIPLVLWWSGYAWFVACGILLLARSVAALAAGDLAAVNRLIGARSVQEEAADELRVAAETVGSHTP